MTSAPPVAAPGRPDPTDPLADPAYRSLVALLGHAVAADASDLHLRPDAVAKIRVGGALTDATAGPVPADQVTALVLASMSAAVREEYAAAMEADYALVVEGLGRFRVNAFRTRGADALVMRRIRDEATTLDALGMPDAVRELALRPRGLVLVTGPTGSGKSTTLAAMIDLVNASRAVHVLTLEDPIEVLHRDKRATVTQREVGSDTHGWGRALKSAMRQDPDVILIGELRDAETVRAALTAAETGHAVFASMHTTDARETVLRLIESFAPEEQPRARAVLAAALEGVICQRLVPRAGGGRACILEIGVSDSRFAEAVADPEKTHDLPEILETGDYSGMQTFDQHLLALVVDGTITLETAEACASNPHDLAVKLRRTGWSSGEETPAPSRPTPYLDLAPEGAGVQ